ncbi:MAG TPA: M23 family metallopeptidase [Gemmatimonadales bacterium]|nr:M23 family metallopeptidase [Gemmatimonadales bacterium]
MPRLRLIMLLLLAPAALRAQSPLPPLPDSAGWGVHVLTLARDARGAVWAGTYGHGIFVLRPGATGWEQIRSDTGATSLSWDFVHAIAFGPRGQVWAGTVGNGWGLSLDDGRTWRNWTLKELGPEWQYVAPAGIVTRGDTTWIATADGIQMTTDDGAHWLALVDSIGPASRGPADSAIRILPSEYIRRITLAQRGILVATLRGAVLIQFSTLGPSAQSRGYGAFPPLNRLTIGTARWRGSPCGIRPVADSTPCFTRASRSADPPADLKTAWFERPIDLGDNSYIDQTYRYGSTMGGNFQPHQGVEFNNPDGTRVLAIGGGTVVYAGAAEAGAQTVAIRHDPTLSADGRQYRIFSVYYHNSSLAVRVGQQVQAGQLIARVGNTGRATNDHLHLEVHAAPTEDVDMVVDSLQRFPPFTTNPELWIAPLPGTGVIAGQVFDSAGQAIPQTRIYGLSKPEPPETPFSFAETYGEKNHPHPLYGEHFAVGDVPPGTYVLGVQIGADRVFRRVVVEEGKLSWVVFRP